MKKLMLISFINFSSLSRAKFHILAATRRLQDGCHDGCENYQYKGKQELVYNTSDTLKKVYYHLFNNAFQPGSEMDARLHSIKDPDGRMVNKVKVDGKEVKVINKA
jgi:hypothetical protein